MSESMSKIEEVARAIAANNGVIWGGPRGDDDPDFMLVRAMYLEMALAAIKAMREPTPEMQEYADHHTRPDSDNLQCPTWYQHAIDAALGEEGR